jgi:hypothetical protein
LVRDSSPHHVQLVRDFPVVHVEEIRQQNDVAVLFGQRVQRFRKVGIRHANFVSQHAETVRVLEILVRGGQLRQFLRRQARKSLFMFTLPPLFHIKIAGYVLHNLFAIAVKRLRDGFVRL